MPLLLRCGVRNICASPARAGPDGVWTVETLADVRRAVESLGMSLDLMYLGVPTAVLSTGDERDAAIQKVCLAVRRAGQARIPALQYNLHMRQWKGRTEPVEGRGGSRYAAWDLAKAEDRPARPSLAGLQADEVWARITHFLERVIPVAAEARVRMAFHPPDPPVPPDNRWKVAQVFDTVEGMQRFVQTADSPYHGLVFCQGSFAEMLPRPVPAIYDVIRWFGSRKKIVSVHFRNLRGGRDRFVETYPDEGDMDMFKAVLAYKECGYAGMLMPDHVPGHPADPENLQGFAFAYGYIAGLIQAAYDV
jgi:mannonate dehydratase